MFKEPQNTTRKLPRSVTATGPAVTGLGAIGLPVIGLAASLVLSAVVTTAALHSPEVRWVAWFCFLPLFVAVRTLRPTIAALAGGLWGASLYLFSTVGHPFAVEAITHAIAPSAGLLALLILIPAVYTGLAARPTRSIGFNVLTLALGWTLIEAVLHLHNYLGPQEGLLTGTQGEGLQLHWLARLLGYIATAFLVASANVSLIGILTTASLKPPTLRSFAGLPHIGAWHPPQIFLPIQSYAFCEAYPRAPPAPVSDPN